MLPPAKRQDRAAVGVLLLAWLLAVLVVDPRAELALNDDWAYSLPVEMLVDHGALRLTFWQSMPLLPQVGWAALFCLPGGFSFTALRLSTLVLGALALAATYRLLRDRGAAAVPSLLGAACVLACPLFVALGHSFMTDVPFLALLALSSLWFLRALTGGARGPLVVAVVLAVLATLVRQIGIVLPIAFAVASLPGLGWGRRWLARTGPPLLVVVGVLPLSRFALEHTVGLPALYGARDAGLTEALRDLLHLHLGVFRLPLERSLLLVLSLGLWLSPFVLALLVAQRGSHPARLRAAGLLGAAVAGSLLVTGFRFPSLVDGNVLLEFAVGPRTIPGAPAELPTSVPRLCMTLLAAWSAGGLLVLVCSRAAEVVRGWRRGARDPAALFAVVVVAVGFGPFALAYGAYFDRYALFLVPMVLVFLLPPAMAEPWPGSASAPAGLLAAVGLLFGIAATHDYLAWNRVRWELARSYADGPVATLDAGFEYDNYVEQRAVLLAGAPNPNRLADRSAATHAIAFTAPPGAVVVARRPTGAWLPLAPVEVVLFRRP